LGKLGILKLKLIMNEIFCKNTKELRDWLSKNHAKSKGIWLITYKGAKRTMTWGEVVEELLCYGWIDSTAGKVDDERSKIWISPRKPKSNWSRVNKLLVEKLVKEDRMTQAGLEKINLAKENGSWTTLDSVENLEVPEDLEKEFGKYKDAKQNFENFPRSAKKIILHWIVSAKTDVTREKRIKDTALKASQNIRANQ
jgi:uncharacterized protein YdeI (YjbR/CyaY-like superfamily)